MQDKWPKVRFVLVTEKKTCFGIFRWNPWGYLPYFCVSERHDPLLMFQVSSRSVQVLERWPKNSRVPVNVIYGCRAYNYGSDNVVLRSLSRVDYNGFIALSL